MGNSMYVSIHKSHAYCRKPIDPNLPRYPDNGGLRFWGIWPSGLSDTYKQVYEK
jgi:hypothetical protein